MRVWLGVALGLGLTMCNSASAQSASSVQGQQAIYDTAQAAYDKSDWTSAVEGFTKLLPAASDRPLSRSQSIIAARQAEAFMHLNRLDDAEVWIDHALPTLPKDDFAGLAQAWLTKASVERYRYDYIAALKDYEQAAGFADKAGAIDLLVTIRVGEAIAGVTVDPALARAGLDSLLAKPDVSKTLSKAMLAQFEDLQARAAVNAGDKAAALTLAAKAVNDSGGLTDKVSLSQVLIRADAGIIARLGGNDSASRQYLTYTGAGRLKNMNWISRHSGELPVCDDEIQPNDSVVVSLVIADDGRVLGAVPIYASHPGRLGVAFAKSVSDWRWDADAVKTANSFWRSTLQLGLRCVTRPRPEQLSKFLNQDVATWLVEHQQLTQSEVMRKGQIVLDIPADDPQLAHPGSVVLAAVAGPIPKTQAEMEKLWSGLDNVKAPPSAYALLISRWAGAHSQAVSGSLREAAQIRVETMDAWTIRLRTQFPAAPALSWLMLEEALERQDIGDFAGARPTLAALAASQTDGSQRSEVLKSVALLHQAISLDRAGDTAAAKASLEQSGLNEQVCSLFDTHPIPQNHRVGWQAYPNEALRWNFEGFAQEAFDIGDDGRVKNVRTVIAYPPYIFDAATEKATGAFTYIPPRLGGKAVGCESQLQLVAYRMGE